MINEEKVLKNMPNSHGTICLHINETRPNEMFPSPSSNMGPY